MTLHSLKSFMFPFVFRHIKTCMTLALPTPLSNPMWHHSLFSDSLEKLNVLGISEVSHLSSISVIDFLLFLFFIKPHPRIFSN